MADGTKNYFVGNEDGWVEVVAGTPAITFLRISVNPVRYPFYVHVGSAPPALNGAQVGTLVAADGDEGFWFNGSTTNNIYVRAPKQMIDTGYGAGNDKLRFDVFTQGGALQ